MRGIRDFERPVSLPQTYSSGRTCAHDGCLTQLSIYNPTPFCSLHSDDVYNEVVPEGYRRCLECDRILPATTDYFHRNGHSKGGLHRKCRDCRNTHNRASKPIAVEPDEKRCPRCGKTKPLTRRYWYERRDDRRWSSYCITCTQDQNREHARRKAAERRAQRELLGVAS